VVRKGEAVKREAELKVAFMAELRSRAPGFVTLRLLDAGAPDRAIVGGGRTTFLEFKHGAPAFDSPGLQELACMRLEAAGECRYVIWQETAAGAGQRTLIVRPRDVHRRSGWSLDAEETFMGFDHRSAVQWLKEKHGL
jgi:hypothetical protein